MPMHRKISLRAAVHVALFAGTTTFGKRTRSRRRRLAAMSPRSKKLP